MAPAKKRSSKKKQAMTPEEFFGVAAPRLMATMRSFCEERGGRYCVVVEGDAWTLDFRTATVREGEEPADVRLTFNPERFASLSSAKVELRKLVVDGDVICEGDRGRIEDLSLLLAFLNR